MQEMPLREWFPTLVVAMEAEEDERRRSYLGEPENYTAFFAPEQGPDVELFRPLAARPEEAMVARKVLAYAGGLGMPQQRQSVASLAQVRPDKARAVFVDQTGRVVDEQGQSVEVPAGAVIVDGEGQLVGPSAAPGPMVTLDGILQMFGIEKK